MMNNTFKKIHIYFSRLIMVGKGVVEQKGDYKSRNSLPLLQCDDKWP